MRAIDTQFKPGAVQTPRQARAWISAALTRDRGRLLGLLSKWQANPADAALRAAMVEALQVSVATCAQRATQLPGATIDDSLPIAAHADDIIELIRRHQVVVIAGETGSGKTTQLPKLCLLAGRGAAGVIGCTQPRRIAARSVARRVAEELRVPVGGALVRPEDPNALAEAIAALAMAPERMIEEGAAGRGFAASRTWAAMAGRYDRLYKSLRGTP